MPDAQGTVSVIGEFLRGYMGETAKREQQKYQDLSGVLSVAEKYRTMAEDPKLSPAEHDHWKQLHVTSLAEADKIMNQKSSGLGSLLKMFGIGKKQANGATSAPPSDWYKSIDAASKSQKSPAPMPRPESLGQAPAPADFGGNAPPEFQQGGLGYLVNQQQSQPAAGQTSVAPIANTTPPDKYAGMNPVMAYNERLKDLEVERRRKEAIQTARETGQVNQEFTRENFNWQQTKSQQEANRRVEMYKASPEYASADEEERSRIVNHLQLGLPYREPTPYRKSVRTYNAQGEPVTQTMENGKVIDEAPTFGMPNEPIIRSIMADASAKGSPISYKQAEEVWGKHQRETAELANTAKRESMNNQAVMNQYRQERLAALREKKKNGGAINTVQAIGLYKSAMNYGKAMLAMNPADVLTMTDAQKQAAINEHARQYVEGGQGQEGIMKWDDLRRVANPAGPAPKTAQEEAMGYTGPAPAAKPGTIRQPPK